MRPSFRWTVLVVLVLLAACGNKGDLVKPPPEAPPAATPAAS